MTDHEGQRVGVIGGGTMGAGIAQVALQSGHRVVLVEQSAERADAAAARIAGALAKLVAKGTLDAAQQSAALSRLTTSTDYEDVAGSSLVVEAVFEDVQAKTAVATALTGVLNAEAIFATNTSSISIDRIADGYARPDQVVGIHFFNPVPVLPLVEIVAGGRTSDSTVSRAEAFARSLGKTPIRVQDRPGFVVNRLLIPMINEAALLAGEGVADVAAIDTAMRLGANHPIGPLALADLVGIDVCLAIMRTLASELDAVKFAPAPLLVSLAAEGKLGRKTGEGFFSYDR